jgi:hypothetical protein
VGATSFVLGGLDGTVTANFGGKFLTADFTGATLSVTGVVGSLLANNVVFTSDYFSGFDLNRGFALSMSNVSPVGDGSTAFTSNVVATYSADKAPVTAIPEPATWAMLIVGFGLVGFAARRRTAVAA